MSLPLTPERLAVVYEALRAFPPFNRMALPPASDVRFKVSRTKFMHGYYVWEKGQHEIRISTVSQGHFVNVAITMAHEMIHLWQSDHNLPLTHGAAFKRKAAAVCRIFGWDANNFS